MRPPAAKLRRGAIDRALDAPSSKDAPSPQQAVAPALLAWAAAHGRHDLPWQLHPTPYRVWVSEVMLQQTQVATVIPYYQRFVARFPDVASLAAAPLDEVLHAWTGLGYYARARNLHRTARLVVEEHHGCLPETIDALQALPGIGRSTAGAILALSIGRRHPILDGNARRVLARVFAVEGDPSSGVTHSRLWALADACTPHQRVADYTQAIMDLGSTVCTRTNVRCLACPLSALCLARRSGRQGDLPSPRRRAERPTRTACALVIRDGTGGLLLRQRPHNGVWGGLWSLPQFDDEAAARAWLASTFPSARFNLTPLKPQHHAFTHYGLNLHVLAASLPSRPELPGFTWYDLASPSLLGLTKAVTNLPNPLCQYRAY